jgi:hypothetical protein
MNKDLPTTDRSQPRVKVQPSVRRHLPPATTVFVWSLGGPAAVLVVVGILVALATGDASTTTIVLPLSGVLSVAVGVVLVTRLPRQRIGWLLWAGGLLIAITRITQGLADHGLTTDPGSVPGAIWFGWVNAWVGLPAVVMLPLFLPLLYPTGRLPSTRWRVVAGGGIAGLVGATLSAAFGPFPTGNYPPNVVNPLAIGGSVGDALIMLGNLLNLALSLVLVLGLGSLVTRYRRAVGTERQQLKWFVFVGSIATLALVVAAVDLPNTVGPLATVDNIAWLAGLGALALMPVAIGIAVLRYRLYELDRLISRTISWVILTVLVAALFVAFVLVFQAVVAPLTGSNEIAVAGSTLLVFGLFAPIRRRVQRLVDRRFNRTRYDAEQTVAAFAGRLRDQVDFEQLRSEILATVNAAVEPASASVWLRQ